MNNQYTNNLWHVNGNHQAVTGALVSHSHNLQGDNLDKPNYKVNQPHQAVTGALVSHTNNVQGDSRPVEKKPYSIPNWRVNEKHTAVTGVLRGNAK